MSEDKGILYLVATPIGNLDDFSFRAVETLKQVDLIAAEDTRHSRNLLLRYGISTKITSLHEHNESRKSESLLTGLKRGESIAIISDAGTPLISDPGYMLVRLAQDSGLRIVPVPGPCALIAALCASGLSTRRFLFEGFLPRHRNDRKARFQTLVETQCSLVFYESSHRIEDCVEDLKQVFPSNRQVVLARELTKIYETIVRCTVGDIDQVLVGDSFANRGEFVIVLEGAPAAAKLKEISGEQERVLRLLLSECSLKKSVSMASEITGGQKKMLYRRALEIKKEAEMR